jgi:hypothetical protein
MYGRLIGGALNHLDTISRSAFAAAVSPGATVSSDESAAAMKNQHGVVIRMRSNTKGLRLNASVEGVTMKLADSQ